jgi:hypothetical protein
VPPVRNLPPGYTVIHPNRDKAAAKVMKAIVVLIMLASVGLMLIVTFGGWSKLQGLKPLNFAWCLLFLVLAYYVWRWKRGVLPIAAALAVLLLLVTVIAGTGQFGSGSATSWFDRNTAGFAAPHSIFGGKGLSPDFIGLMVVLLIPVEVVLIVFAMIAFGQGWNVEIEVPIDEAQRRGRPPIVPPAEPSAA